MLVEVIATSLNEALIAQKYGANRIELIHSFELGGLSPKRELSKSVCEQVKIPTNIMLRPHGNKFYYSIGDIATIKNELEYLRDYTNATGIVFGALNNKNHIDISALKMVIENKGHLNLTFHRAIDVAENTFNAYRELLNYPEINFILTSGGKPTALEGYKIIKQMVELNPTQEYCIILAGSGITPNNAAQVVELTGVKQIHLGTGVRQNNILIKSKFEQLLSSI